MSPPDAAGVVVLVVAVETVVVVDEFAVTA
jgi:hypothetical protein